MIAKLSTGTASPVSLPAVGPEVLARPSASWRTGLPTYSTSRFTLREVRTEDAASLLAMTTAPEVSRFITPPPTSIEGFERFIMWAHAERRAGTYACFVVVPHGMEHAIGLLQLRAIDTATGTAEWGFVFGSEFWGTGLFQESAAGLLTFAFEVLGLHRLEARSAVPNGRGNGALRKIGAVQEGVLRQSFARNGRYYDQVLWSILADDWRLMQAYRRVH